jgi:hypothetical protein
MRNRIIKEGFFRNHELAKLDPLARILFEGLWCLADKSGRLWDRPEQIKVEVLPYDDCDVNAFLDQLEAAQFITRYANPNVNAANNCKSIIQITNFAKHQTLTSWERDHTHSEIPENPATANTSKQTKSPVRRTSRKLRSTSEVLPKNNRRTSKNFRLEQSRAEQSSTEQNRTEQSGTAQHSTEAPAAAGQSCHASRFDTDTIRRYVATRKGIRSPEAFEATIAKTTDWDQRIDSWLHPPQETEDEKPQLTAEPACPDCHGLELVCLTCEERIRSQLNPGRDPPQLADPNAHNQTKEAAAHT